MHSSPRHRRRRQRIEALLDAGLALLAEGGLDGLTVARLADRVDLTPGALYRYYPSKDALLAALLARVLEEWSAAFDALYAAADGADPLVAPIAVLRGYVRLALDRPLPFGLLAVTLADPRILVADPSDAVHVPALQALVDRLAGALAEAVPGDPEPAASTRALVMGVTGVLSAAKLRRFGPTVYDPAPLAHHLVHTVLRGLGASAAALTAATETAEALLDRGGLP